MEPHATPLALETLLAHREWVRRVARALARDEATADDIEQTAWVAAIESPPQSVETPRAWLATVLRRAAGRVRRGESRRARREERAARVEAAAPVADRVAEAESHERVVRAVVGLPEPYRATVVLRWFDGVPPAEIARRMQTTADTVQTRLRRAKEMLREALDDGERDRWRAVLLPLVTGRGAARTGTVAAATGGGALMGFIVSKAAAVAAVAIAGLVVWSLAGGDPPKPVETGDARDGSGDASSQKAPARTTGRTANATQETGDRSAATAAAESPSATLRIRVHRGDVACAAARVIVCRDGKVLATATTGADGIASASAAPGAADVVVLPDGAPGVRVAATLPGDADVSVAPGASVAGLVRVDGAAPRAPVRVLLHIDGKFVDEAANPPVAWEEAWEELSDSGAARDRIAAHTDAEGRFRFDGITAGTPASLSADGYVLAGGPHSLDDVRAPRGDVVLDLVRLPSLRGRVVEAGGASPVVRATVMVAFDEEGDGQGSSENVVDADAHGRFEIPYPELASKLLSLNVSAADGRGERDVEIPKPVPPQWDLGDVALETMRAVEFLVQDDAGHPVAGAVAVVPGRKKTTGAPSDAQGRGHVDLPAHDTPFRVGARGYEPVDASLDAAAPVRVTLHAAARLVVSIDTGGDAIGGGMTLCLRAETGMFAGAARELDEALVAAGAPSTQSTTFGPDGCTFAEFHLPSSVIILDGLRPDVTLHVALVDAIGTVAARADVCLAAAVNTPIRLTPSLPPRPLGGIVRGPDGAPVAMAQVTVAEDPPATGADAAPGTVWTGPDGRFGFDAVCAARVRVLVQARGFVPVALRRGARDGGEVAVELARGRRLLVRVIDAGGEPVSQAAVSAVCPGLENGKGSAATVQADELGDGAYAVDGLPAADVEIVATAGEREGRVTVPASQSAEVVVTLKAARAR
jgi:RNA polymerase sigma-70 factor (ECF subfamily)